MLLLSLLVIVLSVSVITAFILIAVQYFPLPLRKIKRAQILSHK